ncbi:MAG: cytochrome b [Casimicrobiaceae bacterium]
MTPPAVRYGGVAIALHWITALLIVANLLLGLSMVRLALSPQKLQWYQWHKWIGTTVFLLTSLRLLWRLSHPPPPPVPMPDWQRRASRISHAALYVLLLLIPLSGWIYSSATGVQVVYLGLFPLPDLVAKDRALAAVLKVTHLTLNSALFAIVCVHVAAALRHHFVQRDDVLHRMLPLVRHR